MWCASTWTGPGTPCSAATTGGGAPRSQPNRTAATGLYWTPTTVLPDPRSPRQPDGVHERSQLWQPLGAGPSRLARAVDRGRGHLRIAYRHVHAGRHVRSAIEKLDYLVDFGVDFVEVMPVNAFGGTHGWGYDGVGLVCGARAVRRARRLGAVCRRLPSPRPWRTDRRGVQSPRPVGQLPARGSVRICPAAATRGASRSTSPRPTPTRCGATSSTVHCAGCATSTLTACGWTPCMPWSTPPPIHILEELSAETDTLASAIGPSAVVDRRERPERSAADHPPRPGRLRNDRAVGRRHPPRHPHRGIGRTAGLLRRLRVAGGAGDRR